MARLSLTARLIFLIRSNGYEELLGEIVNINASDRHLRLFTARYSRHSAKVKDVSKIVAEIPLRVSAKRRRINSQRHPPCP
ncbi:hypothetical protein F9C07_2170631 [Aspergillus flavus]|uniref:Uncharacterized protein n=1 Tax=Aspergillus flavus (strain ATCC 200026 / FGSC A1120 / IAM 13836 / NRRL 3357 / JCM 12722 / SRRC 167) TaxID=332952 RepID=A0A7U2N2K2_ASPFN|nr:hypothetical protein F9C07_2170631 [Aspergillus flavus]